MRKFLKILILTFLGAVTITSCSDDSDGIPGWPWNDNSTEKPDEPDVAEAKPRYIWIDAAANFPDYANSKENIAKDMEKIKAAGFTDIIVDVRPTTGDVLFNTNVVDQVKRMDVWGNSGYSYYERTETWDYLQAFIEEARIQGLKVNASINTFVGGYLCPYDLGHDGVLFRDESKKGWASVANLADGLTNTMDLLDDETDYGAKFFNPANDDVQNFVLQLLADLAKYDLDGIILDRCRYDDYGLESDFSDISKQKFEEYIGETVANFPADIMAPGTDEIPSDQPVYFKKWLEFRAKVIHDFIVKAREKVKSVNNNIKFGVYVGAWS
ncbi:family 10 glycosylhydrolase, partial [Bacteroides xylanisolvens]|uniref:family 10 glycosylhydrolase n=1 Tax=Bacteroides xylanisolvens TaxID=371601 RepID=UPI00125FABE9